MIDILLREPLRQKNRHTTQLYRVLRWV